jgi:hypothetical protein
LNPSLYELGKAYRPPAVVTSSYTPSRSGSGRSIGRYRTREQILEQLSSGPQTVAEITKALNASSETDYQRISAMVVYLKNARVIRAKREIRVSLRSGHAYRCNVYSLPKGGAR